jgi:hypothetical protein
MPDCNKTTCIHHHDLAYHGEGEQLPPPVCESCCYFYPSHLEEHKSIDITPTCIEDSIVTAGIGDFDA